MAIEIKEYIGAKLSFVESTSTNASVDLTEAINNTYSNKIAKNSLMVEIEGLHSVLTRNDTFYTDKAMIKSEKLWTNPYEIPVIMHHDEKKGVTIGRVKHAFWTDKNTRSNTGALRFITNIAHKDGIEGVKNGTLSTVSVGILANEVRCSICNQDIATYGECEHEKGAYYEGEKCYWRVESFEPKELSFVIVPSDQYAHIIDVYEPSKKNLTENLTEGKEVNKMDTWLDLIHESEKVALSESTEKQDKKKEEETTEEVVETVEETKEVEEVKETTEETAEITEEKEEALEETTETKEEKAVEEETCEEEQEEKVEQKEEIEKKEIEEEVKKDIKVEDTDIYKNIKVALDAVKTENDLLKKEIEDLKAKLASEIKLKESAENQVIQMKTEQKKGLVKEINKLRESVNFDKENEEELMKNNEETLHMTIKTLKEFSSKVGAMSIPKVESKVAITESKDNTQKNTEKKVKETVTTSNINFEESLIVEKILSAAFSGNNN